MYVSKCRETSGEIQRARETSINIENDNSLSVIANNKQQRGKLKQ